MIDIALVQLLADGEFHSGEELGESLGLSRAAIWNRIRTLRDVGVVTHSVRGKGYRIPGGLDLLDASFIQDHLTVDTRRSLDVIEVHQVISSTNDLVMARAKQGRSARQVVFAEQQTAGRGRRGRVWVSPFAANLYFTLSREFPSGLAAIDGLSLVMGVALCEALREVGVAEVGLKWPNDLVVSDRKLGGILIEVNGEAAGACVAVIGIGLNVAMPESPEEIGQPWTDLHSQGIRSKSRNTIAAVVLNHLAPALDEFARDGFSVFVDRWRSFDVIAGKYVDVLVGPNRISGMAAGIDRQGALLVDTPGGRMTFHGGEVSVRPMP